jgi:hypothetical protein
MTTAFQSGTETTPTECEHIPAMLDDGILRAAQGIRKGQRVPIVVFGRGNRTVIVSFCPICGKKVEAQW